ncbi:MAG: hypothetical protein IJV97_05115 [Alphaproteobacteria bacterium]|nr:hypothetical protein [Alphaproteobacteria bacterium]
MKKLAILSPLVLLATTALAQDSTCILQPSCSQLGYTSAEADCGTAKVLRCPFDVSQVACLSGGSDSGSGGGDNYNPNDPNNELGDVIAFEVYYPAGGYLYFTYGGGNIVVDCETTSKFRGATSKTGTATGSCQFGQGHSTITARGTFTFFQASYPNSTGTGNTDLAKYIKTILKLDKSGLTKMKYICSSSTMGFIPPLSNSMEDTTEMFKSCSNLSGAVQDFSTLPNLTTYTDMFAGSNITRANNPTWPAEAW